MMGLSCRAPTVGWVPASLVRAEHRSHVSPAKIAETWGEGISGEQIEARRQLEDQLEK
jgi:hypothetical protein